jgi:nucleotide-binding universal stress UspA family protein
MGSRLLLAIDQYAPGQAAVDFTVDLASMSNPDVYVFHVREVPSSLGVFPLESEAEAQVLVEETVRRLQSAGIAAEGEACSEHKSRVALLIVVEERLKRKCNAIVLGSLRLRGLQSMIGHGTRERVLKMSSLPVIVTPPALCASGPSRARL